MNNDNHKGGDRVNRIMRNGWLPALGLCLLLAASPALAGDSVSRTFDFPSGGMLVVDVESGHVEIRTGNGSEITVEVSVERGDLDDYVDLSFNQTGDGLEIIGKKPRGGRRNHDGGIEYRITAPSRMDLEVSSGGGHIQIEDVEGQVEVSTGGGHVKIQDIMGDLDVRTGGGHLEIGRVDGTLFVKTGGGHVEVDDVRGDVEASSGGGHIEVGNVEGDLEVHTGDRLFRPLRGPRRQVAHVPHGGLHHEIGPQVAVDRLRLRRRLDDHQVLSGGVDGLGGGSGCLFLGHGAIWRYRSESWGA